MLKADQKLCKEERLKSRKVISELFENGQILHNHPFKVLFKLDIADKLKFPAQIAISVSKRNFKLAVTRNYIKRKIRESYRRNKHLLYTDLEKFDQNIYFFVIYNAKKDLDYALINESMILLLKKISHKLKQLQS